MHPSNFFQRFFVNVPCLAIGLFLMCPKIAFGGLLSTAESPTGTLDVRTGPVARLVSGTVRISPIAENRAAAPQLTLEGESVSSWTAEVPLWNTAQVADGPYALTLKEDDKEFIAEMMVCNHSLVHYGALEEDEVWSAEQEHILWGQGVRVSEGVTLTIADGAVVKFCDGAKLSVNEGARLVFADVETSTAGQLELVQGEIPWQLQSEETFNGGAAWRSGAIDHSETTAMEATLSGAGTLSFCWKVSSESGYDYLRFYLDGERQASISGSTDWATKEYEIVEGTHTVRWEYSKDGNVSEGSDCGWVDAIQWLPVQPVPTGAFFVHISRDEEDEESQTEKYELDWNGEVVVENVHPSISNASFTGALQPLTAIGCKETPWLMRTGEIVTLTSRVTGSLLLFWT